MHNGPFRIVSQPHTQPPGTPCRGRVHKSALGHRRPQPRPAEARARRKPRATPYLAPGQGHLHHAKRSLLSAPVPAAPSRRRHRLCRCLPQHRCTVCNRGGRGGCCGDRGGRGGCCGSRRQRHESGGEESRPRCPAAAASVQGAVGQGGDSRGALVLLQCRLL